MKIYKIYIMLFLALMGCGPRGEVVDRKSNAIESNYTPPQKTAPNERAIRHYAIVRMSGYRGEILIVNGVPQFSHWQFEHENPHLFDFKGDGYREGFTEAVLWRVSSEGLLSGVTPNLHANLPRLQEEAEKGNQFAIGWFDGFRKESPLLGDILLLIGDERDFRKIDAKYGSPIIK